MNSKCVEQRCGKREIRKTDYDVALQVGENPMSAETWSADSIVICVRYMMASRTNWSWNFQAAIRTKRRR